MMPPPMSGGIHMDMITSVVVVERPDLEKENREYLEQRLACGAAAKCLLQDCKNKLTCTGGHHGDGGQSYMEDLAGLPELQDPSGYLTLAPSVEDMKDLEGTDREEQNSNTESKSPRTCGTKTKP